MLKVNILTPEKVVFTGEAKAVIFPGVNGLMGIEMNHAELINELSSGDITLRGDNEQTFGITGGLVRVNKNTFRPIFSCQNNQ